MVRSAHNQSLRRFASWLLAIGVFAMALQALGGAGFMPRAAAGGGFQAEICTSKGVGKLAAALQSGQPVLPDAGHQDCCTLCGASAPLLLAGAALGVPPAPTFGRVFFGNFLPFPAAVARLSPPPRGPPA